MNHLDLFSGIGGFALAARRVGWTTASFCEIDPFCQSVLRRHWPDVPVHLDVSTFSPLAIRANDSAPPLADETMRETSGQKHCGSFANYDPVGSCLKTFLARALFILSGRVVISEITTMPSGRSILRLRSETMSGGASGLWPTPTAKANHNSPSMRKWPAYRRLQDNGGASPSRWEWMMGYPAGWTVSEQSETQSNRRSPK